VCAGVCNGSGASCYAEFEFSCEVSSDASLDAVVVANDTFVALNDALATSLDIDASRIVRLDLSVDSSYKRRRLLDNGFVTLWLLVAQSVADGLVGDQGTANAVRAATYPTTSAALRVPALAWQYLWCRLRCAI
jgi:hypothetical protein